METGEGVATGRQGLLFIEMGLEVETTEEELSVMADPECVEVWVDGYKDQASVDLSSSKRGRSEGMVKI